ncbi:hypothetical protein AMS68_005269 [Peltaster fructicola]|uniref:Uncharacterized protein n=1 Tax=Peltaster fructicola TaxID=286661 RepID=A0A6H0XYA3_9PEZI|nr:hypothetical protein AMS68_005269 [Peltaster fructicola]
MADERFRALATDPRYRLPSRKQAQTAVDPRFKRLFTDDGFQKKASVDRYGRKVKNNGEKKDIQRRFRLEEEKASKKEAAPDSNSDEEQDSERSESLKEDVDRDPMREGFSGSSSEEESTSDEDSDVEEDLAEGTAGNEQTEDVPMGEVSKRIAVVNLDWDNVRAADIMAVAQSFAPNGGKVVSTKIYPSEFGKERMEKEELEGPPREIFAGNSKAVDEGDDSEEDSDEDERIRKRLIREQAKDGEEFDTAKLRQYQLERLRYYYAVVTCDNEATGKALYDNMDGREYLTTANFFDLRFIPDDTSFDEEARDECEHLPDGYKPNDFKTEALTHSKVRLTWDDDDTTRKEIQKRAFSRAGMDEEDLKAYIGSDSSDADSVTSRKSSAEVRKLSKKEAAKAKMRAALGLPDEPTRSKFRDEPVGDMQITFSAGLSSKSNGDKVFENEPQDAESTKERYIRKERDRRQKRKDKMKSSKTIEQEETVEQDDNADDGFNDPFFNDPAAAAIAEKKARKAEKDKKREIKAAEQEAAASRRAELELLMAEDDGKTVQHFDMKEIEKAEKLARKKGKKKAEEVVKDDFQLETEDPRFKQLFDSHEYAIDPTNPKFKGTQGMKALLEEGRKKRKNLEDDGQGHTGKKMKGSSHAGGKKAKDNELNSLVARLKGGSAAR